MRLLTLTMLAMVACDEGGDCGQPLCEGGGDYDLAASGSGLKGLDGELVWIAAVEPERSPHTDEVTVLLEDTVVAGVFSATCEDSLRYNMVYPSAAIVIDANGDGVCSDGDRWFQWQRYGWDSDQVLTITDADLVTLSGDTTWGDRTVCEYYVPDDLL